MAAENLHKLNVINQKNEPHHEKEHVKIVNAAHVQSFWPKTRETHGTLVPERILNPPFIILQDHLKSYVRLYSCARCASELFTHFVHYII